MSTIEILSVCPSDCLGRGVDVSVRVDGHGGEVTLAPAPCGGGYCAWGEPGHWVDGALLVALRDRVDFDDVLFALAAEAADAADAWAADTVPS